MVLDILKYNFGSVQNNNICKKMELTWENKGIVLGIIYFLLKKNNFLKNKRIIITNKRTRKIMKYLFDDLNIKKIPYQSEDNFYINLKTSNNDDLIINNLLNFKVIRAKKVFLLPYYDEDNPIVMFLMDKYSDGQDVEVLKNKINTFTEYERGKTYQKSLCISYNCWDTHMEYLILKKYVRLNNYLSISRLYKFISSHIRDDICQEINLKKEIQFVPILAPYEKHYIERCFTLIKDNRNKVEQEKLKNNLSNVLEYITEKIRQTNKLLDLDLINIS